MAVRTLSLRLAVAALLVAAMFMSGLPQAPAVLAAPASVDEETQPESTSPASPDGERGDDIMKLRTRYSKTYRADSGSGYETEIATRPIHFRGADNAWLDIDPTLVSVAPGLRSDAANKSDVRINTDSAAPALASFSPASGGTVSFGLEGARSATGSVSGPSVVYDEVLPHTSVKLTALADGLKEELILASADGPREFRFPLITKGLTARAASDGSIEFLDSSGDPQAVMPRGWMRDSSTQGDAPGAVSGAVDYELVRTGERIVLVVRLDDQWLEDAARTYPVVVDPSIVHVANVVPTGDSYVTDSAPDSSFSQDGSLLIGMSNVGAGTANRHVSFAKFNLTALADRQIVNADLRLFNWSTATCAPRASNVLRVTAPINTTTVTWNTKPANTSPSVEIASYASSHGNEGLGCNNAYVNYGVTQTVRNWVDDPYDSTSTTWPNNGFELRADNGADASYYKTFASSEGSCCGPLLVIRHNLPPSAEHPLEAWENGVHKTLNPSYLADSTLRGPQYMVQHL